MKVELLHGVTIDTGDPTGELEDSVKNAFAAWCEGDPSPGRRLGFIDILVKSFHNAARCDTPVSEVVGGAVESFIRTKDGLPSLQDIYNLRLLKDVYAAARGSNNAWCVYGKDNDEILSALFRAVKAVVDYGEVKG